MLYEITIHNMRCSSWEIMKHPNGGVGVTGVKKHFKYWEILIALELHYYYTWS